MRTRSQPTVTRLSPEQMQHLQPFQESDLLDLLPDLDLGQHAEILHNKWPEHWGEWAPRWTGGRGQR